VSAPVSTPALSTTLAWLAAHAQFPRSRLAPRAELLLLIASAAAAEEAEVSGGPNLIQRRDNAKDAAMRAHALRRSAVHFKCDNSAKV
jgi:hypothetical protein